MNSSSPRWYLRNMRSPAFTRDCRSAPACLASPTRVVHRRPPPGVQSLLSERPVCLHYDRVQRGFKVRSSRSGLVSFNRAGPKLAAGVMQVEPAGAVRNGQSPMLDQCYLGIVDTLLVTRPRSGGLGTVSPNRHQPGWHAVQR